MKTNPKHIRAMKDGKAPLEYLITSVDDGDAWVMKGGADKYGIRNWLIDKILGSTYEGAIRRHFKAWAEGEDIDLDSGKHHFHHIRACCAIVLDAEKHGQLIDDRDRKESIDQNENQTATQARFRSPITHAEMTIEDYHDLADTRFDNPDCIIREPRDAGTEHECIVQYSDPGPPETPFLRVIETDGPFKNYEAADKYIRANPNNRLGLVSIYTLNPQEE